jgi:uncharacterized protein (TIGR00730 family)
MRTVRVCVFCGSKTGDPPIHAEAARRLGESLACRGLGLVYGGGNIGLMGVLADAVLARGGEVIGVIPRFLMDKELGHRGVTRLMIVESMHERKALMAEHSDAFVAIPGGFGTAEEWFEILTWRQLHLHDKPIGLLDTNGFFRPLLDWMDVMVKEGFVKQSNRDLIVVREDADDLLDVLFR